MKTKFAQITIALCALFFLNGCKENNGGGGGTNGPITADVTYSTPNLDDIVDLMDVEVTYTDKNGEQVKEKIKDRKWSKKLTGVAVPFKASAKLVFTKLKDVQYTKEDYMLGTGVTIEYKLSSGRYYSDGTKTFFKVSKDQVEEALDEIAKSEHKFSVYVEE